jgi:hypothetical protein
MKLKKKFFPIKLCFNLGYFSEYVRVLLCRYWYIALIFKESWEMMINLNITFLCLGGSGYLFFTFGYLVVMYTFGTLVKLITDRYLDSITIIVVSTKF